MPRRKKKAVQKVEAAPAAPKAPVLYIPTGLITPHFGWGEFCKSATASRHKIKNLPGPTQRLNMEMVAENMEDLRVHIDGPILVKSMFRNDETNRLVGGSPNSYHRHGQAIDIEAVPAVGGPSNLVLAQLSVEVLPTIDRAVLEFYDDDDETSGWLHLQFCSAGKLPRREWFRAVEGADGETRYIQYEPDFVTPFGERSVQAEE